MMETSGAAAILSMLEDEGVEFIFGNPGTTELPLIMELPRAPSLRYVLGLQEAAVVGMADGYSRASGKLSCVMLHAAPGVGNAIGSIYNAKSFGTPMLILAGQQARGFALREPRLYHDLVALTAPLVKWAVEVTRFSDLPLVIRRAAKVATAAPCGPVFVSLPEDVLREMGELDLGRSTRVDPCSIPGPDSLRRCAEILRAAKQPCIVAGREVYWRDALDEVSTVAERLGAPVFGDTTQDVVVFPSEHPSFLGHLPRDPAAIQKQLSPYDVVVVLGGDALALSRLATQDPMPAGATVVEIGSSAWELGKNRPANLALRGDVKQTLAALAEVLPPRVAPGSASWPKGNWASGRGTFVSRVEQLAATQPIEPDYLSLSIAEIAPPETIIVNEALTSARGLRRALSIRDRQRYYGESSGGIGWGMPAAIGVSLAVPERPVLAVLGDGSALYTPQALWTAANLRRPIVFVIANNGGYQILRRRLLDLEDTLQSRATAEMFDLTSPRTKYVELAAAFGIPAKHIERADAVRPALRWAFEQKGPALIEVAVAIGEG